MGRKNEKKKKGKGAEKTAMKTEKNAEKKMKRLLKSKGEENIEALIAEYQDKGKVLLKPVEEKCDQPSSRSNATLTPHPEKEQLILLGGEFFNGSKTFMYNDMYLYNIKNNSWTVLKAPGAPPPRSSHQTVAVKQGGGQLWMFGGEFASPSQSQFYHYKDLWMFHFHSNKWEKISVPGGPSARSGHRMVACKRSLFVFGGFHDNLKGDYRVYNDVHIFSLDSYTWTLLEPSGIPPPPRSGCCLAPTQDERHIVMFGGYSKTSVKKDVDKGTIHTDMYILSPDGKQEGIKWRWNQMKQSGTRPPPRCSCAVVGTPGDRALVFGGVVDDEDEENIEGRFYNDMFTVELDRGKWHEVLLRSKKEHKKKRRRKKDETTKEDAPSDEDEDIDEDIDRLTMTDEEQQPESSTLPNCDPTGASTAGGDGVFTVSIGPQSSSAGASGAALNSNTSKDGHWWPCGRMNAMLAVRQGLLYMYGGMYEEGDKQLTLQDMYSLDLHKLDDWKTLIHNEADKLVWEPSDSSDSDDDDDEGDDMETDDAPAVKKDEELNDYFSRSKDYWLDKAEQVAEEEGLTVTAKQMKKAAFRMAEEYVEQNTSNS